MKAIVVREVSALVLKAPSSAKPSKGKAPGGKVDGSTLRSAINPHARYYAIVTFNQIILSSKTQADKDVASRLVEVYFELFKDIVGEGRAEDDGDENDHSKPDVAGYSSAKAKNPLGREEMRKNREKEKLKLKGKERQTQQPKGLIAEDEAESKVISAILTGINRALPFAGMDNQALDKHMDTLFRITHEATFNVSIQALVLIQKVSESRPVSIRDDPNASIKPEL
jgi:ribosome biogenesis protein MAK21